MGQTNHDVVGTKTATKTASFTVDDKVGTYLVDSTAGAVVITLPTAASAKWRQIAFKKIDASGNAITLDGAGAETIDGAATQAVAVQYTAVVIQSDGVTWWIISTL